MQSKTPKNQIVPDAERQKLGIVGLSAMVFSSVVGGGIYDISQNMACGAALGATIISWIVTAVGMLFLVMTFKILAKRRTDLKGGLYQYAREGFGNFIGFNVAWGFWLCTAFGNVAYAVMLNDSAASLFPVLHEHRLPTVIFGTVLIWLMYFIVSRGIRTASSVNIFISAVKLTSICFIIGILFIFFKVGLFTTDIWGQAAGLGSVGGQVKTTMLSTLWCFVGIEGAVTMSSRAKREKDVGKAGIIGFLSAWTLYVLVTLLSFGVMTQQQLAGLPDPSIAYILKSTCGDWAYWFVVVAIFISLLGSWVSWTLSCSEVPYEAAVVKLFPRRFLKINKKNMPSFGMILSCVIMNLTLCLVVTADSVYQAALTLTSLMALPAYLFCALFLCKDSLKPGCGDMTLKSRKKMIIGTLTAIFCGYIFYSTGWQLLLGTLVLYLPGIFVFIKAHRQYYPHKPLLTRGEKPLFALLLIGGIVALVLIFQGEISF